MAIGKTHYKQVAEVMQRAGETIRLYREKPKGMSYHSASLLWADVINRLADIYAADNRNFNKKKFYAACAQLTESELLDRVEF